MMAVSTQNGPASFVRVVCAGVALFGDPGCSVVKERPNSYRLKCRLSSKCRGMGSEGVYAVGGEFIGETWPMEIGR